MSWLDESNFVVTAKWARLGATPEWIAERADALSERVGGTLGLGSWRVVGPWVDWAGTADEKTAIVASQVNDGGTGAPQIVDGYAMSLSAQDARLDATVSIHAGAQSVGRRLPTHDSMLDVNLKRPGVVSGEQGDALVAAMVEAWSPLSVVLSTGALNVLAKRGMWKISAGYRLWLSDEVGPIGAVAEGVTKSRLGGGTLLSVPDEWDAQRVVDAMAVTRELNGLDELPHDPPPVVRPARARRVETPVPVSSGGYREQISGWLALPDGRVPVWKVPDGHPLSETGFVAFDGRTLRGPEQREVLLMAFDVDSVPEMREWPDTDASVVAGHRLRELALDQVRVKDPDAVVEWHFADQGTAEGVSWMLRDDEIMDVVVRYTPRAQG